MDSLITAAARALAAGDLLGVLNRVALRDDAHALALRGIAMAQLGDFGRAKTLLRSAAHAFGQRQAVARARCIVADAEVALASRDLAWDAKALEQARVTLEKHGDRSNAAHARYLEARHLLLIGQLRKAEGSMAKLGAADLAPALRVVQQLVVAGIAIRRVQARAAREALMRAERAARSAGIPALWGEVDAALRLLDQPAARRISAGADEPLCLDEVETLFASRALVIDACRLTVRQGKTVVPLASRRVPFTLVRALAEVWPSPVPRDVLVSRAFRIRRADDTLRARLRVEIGRLRRELTAVAGIDATPDGFVLRPKSTRQVVVLSLPVEDEYASVLALLSDGEAWSSSALGLALNQSQRSVQRALDELAAAGKVQPYGLGRSRRWLASLPGFTTALLLPVAMGHG